ncbi:dynein regulatory complex subunit 3 [Discoglossus pictus]
MSWIYDTIGPNVIDSEMLKSAAEEQGPQEEAGLIAKMEGINFKDITSLRLDFKNILKIDNLWHLHNLTKLQLDNNIIEKIQGLDMLVHLVWLDLSFNNIEVIEGLDALTKLENLSLFNNRISTIGNMDNLKNLQILSLGNNNLTSLENVTYLRKFKALQTLNLAGNPLSKDEQYKLYIAAHLPNLVYLDFRLLDENIKAIANVKFQYSVEELAQNEALEMRQQEKEEKKQKELESHKAAFIEYLNGPALFEDMYSEDVDVSVLNSCLTYRNKCVAICQKIFEFGLDHHKKREEEVSIFNECLQEAITENQDAGAQKIQEFEKKNNEILYELTQITDALILDSKMYKYNDDITQLSETLMISELQLVDQLEEIMKDYERNILDMSSTFLETVQGIRELENHHHEMLSDICVKIQNQLMSGENEMNMSDELRMVFIDKDSVVNAVDASHDIHLLKIDNREDELVTKIKNWSSNIIQKLQNDEIQRNRKRVLEINTYIDHLREELDNLDVHEQI